MDGSSILARKVRCIDCGFLALTTVKEDNPQREQFIGVADPQSREPGAWYDLGGIPCLQCFRRKYDLVAEETTAEAEIDSQPGEPDPWAAEKALANVIRERRPCELFETYVVGSSLQWHIDVQQRRKENRTERWWRALFLVVGALLGAGVTAVVGLLTRF
jgi:hypothetical protein